jgi:hypothetical protein
MQELQAMTDCRLGFVVSNVISHNYEHKAVKAEWVSALLIYYTRKYYSSVYQLKLVLLRYIGPSTTG